MPNLGVLSPDASGLTTVIVALGKSVAIAVCKSL